MDASLLSELLDTARRLLPAVPALRQLAESMTSSKPDVTDLLTKIVEGQTESARVQQQMLALLQERLPPPPTPKVDDDSGGSASLSS